MDDDQLGVDAPDTPGDGTRGPIVELMRKAAFAGLGALFMTEEGIRSLAGQLKLPKEALGFVLSQAERTKDEVGRVLSDEVRRFLRSDKLRAEFLQLLSGMRVEVTAHLRLVPDPERTPGEPPKPQVKVTSVRTRGSRKKPG
ncbi:MAG TPA: hypothetical protein VMT11_20900 [Myxococcaceae bacterium]|nr:hypothetical protein [Myxococcaceae bacterium]